ncbi:MAG: leucyl/phenylalanyl-tRNA--protein transferase [Chitinophagales bacterium]|nr:leucyl/phenylalanyl-tRNA--protein transferase [Chitinophagales bacterium]
MIYFIQKENSPFPNPDFAEEDGLLAAGGTLSVQRLVQAYTSGIFPWYSLEEIPFWFAPDPRFVLFPDKLKITKSMLQLFKHNAFRVTYNACFKEVIINCAIADRKDDAGTWITPDFIDAYIALHKEGYAHSVEVWKEKELVGGLYGVAIGKIFAGESMFSIQNNASKYALIALIEKLKALQFLLVDCQVHSAHLESMGAEEIPRNTFMDIIKKNNSLIENGLHQKIEF